MCKLGVISQERLKIKVKLLLSANRKTFTIVISRLAQQRMTLSDAECLISTSSASRVISAVAELLVICLLLLQIIFFVPLSFLLSNRIT